MQDDTYPIGTVLSLGVKENDKMFNKYLFEYFESLSSGYTGWGVSFSEWLEIVKGWSLTGYTTIEKIPTSKELIDEMGIVEY